MNAGRPPKYRPEFCERIVELAKRGFGVAEWASELGVDRTRIHHWANEHDDFAQAYARAKDEELAYFERAGRENLDNKNFNAHLWVKMMTARFREDYAERREIEQTIHGLPTPLVQGIQFQILDPAKLETPDLEQLADMMQRQQSPVIEHQTINPITESNLNDRF